MDYCDISFCQKIPKVELHAHANGSLRDETVSKLLSKSSNVNLKPCSVIIKKGEQRTMSEGFEMFRIIHELVNSNEVLLDCVQEVISDFAKDNVKYLELRSTPRDVSSTNMTKRSYIETVLNSIQKYMYDHRESSSIIVKYLPSIDRKLGVNNAHEVVKLAQEYMLCKDGLVTGVDFSGNPYVNNGKDYFEPLLYAKKANLNIAAHLAEVDNLKTNEETAKLLQLPPDRIGHGTFIHNNNQLSAEVLNKQIPIEICLTSNIKTCTAPSDYTKHHLIWWKCKKNHPCILGTDDKGIFATSLSNEYYMAANAMKMTQKQVFEWSKESINHIFDGQQTKSELYEIWEKSKFDLWPEKYQNDF